MDISKQKPATDCQPKTNVAALFLLVLVAIIVSFVALGWGSSISQEVGSDVQNNPAADNNAVQMQSLGAAVDLPAGLLVDETATAEKYLISIGGNQAHEVVSFESSLSTDQLTAEYQNWFESNNYTITNYKNGGRAASMAASNNGQEVIILISYLNHSDKTRVEVLDRTVQ